ncbi:hypothetical protein CALCODRAFT_510359 [Calocera cornea HHB12733]|uniref:DUF6532 domain-containing protein n=1 Tax=Calocera cornea HHB12733 TaxID=1353952 RepID=A0A165EK12_9BASI|nr:hypothetical protein CALCODRAFT_510359 [Calocera cornea HHB12733]
MYVEGRKRCQILGRISKILVGSINFTQSQLRGQGMRGTSQRSGRKDANTSIQYKFVSSVPVNISKRATGNRKQPVGRKIDSTNRRNRSASHEVRYVDDSDETASAAGMEMPSASGCGSSDTECDRSSHEISSVTPPTRKSGTHAVMSKLSPAGKSIAQIANRVYRCKIETEDAFPNGIASGRWVGLAIEQRQAQLRGEVKTVADAVVRQRYLGNVVTLGTEKIADEVKAPSRLYEHPAISDVFVAAYYRRKDTDGSVFKEEFAKRSNALLALPVTALQCSLSQWSTGLRKSSAAHKFSAAGWEKHYRDHMSNVRKFQSAFPSKYNQIMDNLMLKGLATSGDLNDEEPTPTDYVGPLIERLRTLESLGRVDGDEEPFSWGDTEISPWPNRPTDDDSMSMHVNSGIEEELARLGTLQLPSSSLPLEAVAGSSSQATRAVENRQSRLSILSDDNITPIDPVANLQERLEIGKQREPCDGALLTNFISPATGSWYNLARGLPALRIRPGHFSEGPDLEDSQVDVHVQSEAIVHLAAANVEEHLPFPSPTSAIKIGSTSLATPIGHFRAGDCGSSITAELPGHSEDDGFCLALSVSPPTKPHKLSFGSKTSPDMAIDLYTDVMTPTASPSKAARMEPADQHLATVPHNGLPLTHATGGLGELPEPVGHPWPGVEFTTSLSSTLASIPLTVSMEPAPVENEPIGEEPCFPASPIHPPNHLEEAPQNAIAAEGSGPLHCTLQWTPVTPLIQPFGSEAFEAGAYDAAEPSGAAPSGAAAIQAATPEEAPLESPPSEPVPLQIAPPETLTLEVVPYEPAPVESVPAAAAAFVKPPPTRPASPEHVLRSAVSNRIIRTPARYRASLALQTGGRKTKSRQKAQS